jgi:hypothetical protein
VLFPLGGVALLRRRTESHSGNVACYPSSPTCLSSSRKEPTPNAVVLYLTKVIDYILITRLARFSCQLCLDGFA